MEKKVEDLLSGDKVQLADGTIREVKFVDKSLMGGQSHKLAILFDGMNGKWVFCEKTEILIVVI